MALLLGGGGGWAFYGLHLPLPWMLGAVCLTVAGSLGGLPLDVPSPIRTGMLVVLGLLIGSGFSPEVLASLPKWSVSITAVLVYTVVLAWLAYHFFRRVARYSPVNAFFAGLPGGLAAVIFIGAEVGAELRLLSLIHSMRIVMVCFAVPTWLNVVRGGGAGSLPLPERPPLQGLDIALLAVCGVVGFLGARRLRLPAPFLLGPMVLSAIVHMTGLTAAKPPDVLIRTAQIVIGSAIGCRFVGVSLRRVAGTLGLGAVSALGMLAVALICAWLLHHATGLPFDAMLLSLAPGGLPEMTLIALSLDIDLAMVVAHHLVRVLFINLASPALFRWLIAERDGSSAETSDGKD